MMKKHIVFVLALALTMFVFPGHGQAAKLAPVTIQVGISHDQSNGQVQALYQFAELCAQRSGGAISIKVFPNDQLSNGSQPTAVQMLRDGDIKMSFHAATVYSNVDPRFALINLPFLNNDFADADRRMNGELGTMFRDVLSNLGLTCLGTGENGFRYVTNSKRVIKTVADLKGLKIRCISSNLALNAYKALGADATIMNWNEVFTSLQQGAIDGQDNPLQLIYSSALYEVQKYISLWNMIYDPMFLCVNTEFWNSLSGEQQTIIAECAAEATEKQKVDNRAGEADFAARMTAENGVTVTPASEMDIAGMKKVILDAGVYSYLEGLVGAEAMGVALK